MPNISSPALYIYCWYLYDCIIILLLNEHVLKSCSLLFSPIICYSVLGPLHWMLFKTCSEDIIIFFSHGLFLLQYLFKCFRCINELIFTLTLQMHSPLYHVRIPLWSQTDMLPGIRKTQQSAMLERHSPYWPATRGPCPRQLVMTLFAKLKTQHWHSTQVTSSVFSLINLLRWWLLLQGLFFSAGSFLVALVSSVFKSFSSLFLPCCVQRQWQLFISAWPSPEPDPILIQRGPSPQISGKQLKMGYKKGKF